jgi:hypothetical protein
MDGKLLDFYRDNLMPGARLLARLALGSHRPLDRADAPLAVHVLQSRRGR